MGDLGKGVGKSIGNLGCVLPVASLLAASLIVALAVPALAADISTVQGDDFRMAKTKLSKRLTQYADPAADQLRLDGTPAPRAPAWSDIESVSVTTAKAPPKLLQKMSSDYPPGAEGVFYGDAETLGERDPVVYVVVRMAKALPRGSLGQQVEVGFSGDAATPVQNGTALDTWAGTETFTLAGLFSNGVYDVGTTDVGGRQAGLELEVGDYYDRETGAMGFYSPGNATWYLVLPRARDTRAIKVSVRSSAGVGSVIDRLDLPGGGHFIDLSDPTGGYRTKKAGPLLTCRVLETFNGEAGTIDALDPDSNLVRYTAGIAARTKPKVAAEVLASAIEAAGPVSVAVSAVGGDGDPPLVPGELAVAPAGHAVTLEFEVPEGQWSFALAEELELKTPAGERIIDHMTLTGPAGVQVGPGLDGYVAGDLACVEPPAEEPPAAAVQEPPTEPATEPPG